QQPARSVFRQGVSEIIDLADSWNEGQAAVGYDQYANGKVPHYSVVRGKAHTAIFPSPEANPLTWTRVMGPLLTVYPADKKTRETMMRISSSQVAPGNPRDFSPSGGITSLKYDLSFHPRDDRRIIAVSMIQNHYVRIPKTMPGLKKRLEGYLAFGLRNLLAKAQFLGVDLFISKEAIRKRESIVRNIRAVGKQLRTPVFESPEGFTIVKPSEKRIKLWEGLFEKNTRAWKLGIRKDGQPP
ncbi:MAG: hypothetical protein ABH863_04950, partial [Candidatus Micrarchaeota archaeon]